MKFNVSCHVSYDEFVLFFLKHQEWNIWIQQTIQTLEESRDCKVDKSDVPQVGSDPELKKNTHTFKVFFSATVGFELYNLIYCIHDTYIKCVRFYVYIYTYM